MIADRKVVSNRSLGFTLVELLVVIGIIALLIGILLPSLSKARDKSKEVACSSNLHQMGIGMILYLSENGYYPGSIGGRPNGNTVSIWQTRLRKVMKGAGTNLFNCPSCSDDAYWNLVYATGPFFATANSGDDGYGYTLNSAGKGEKLLFAGGNVPGGYTAVKSCYGYNDWGIFGAFECPADGMQKGMGGDCGTGTYTFNGQTFNRRELKGSQVRLPSDMIVITDRNTFSPNTFYQFNVDPTTPAEYPSDVHKHGGRGVIASSGYLGSWDGGSNVLWADGHVSWMSQKDLVDVNPKGNMPPTSDNGKWMAIRKLWNNDNNAWAALAVPN